MSGEHGQEMTLVLFFFRLRRVHECFELFRVLADREDKAVDKPIHAGRSLRLRV